MRQGMQQAWDFKDECDALHAILEPLDEAAFDVPTQFKGWTINHVLQHLHHFNIMADLSLTDPDRFAVEFEKIFELRRDMSSVEASDRLLQGIKGRALLDAWRSYYTEMTPHFANADPKQRLKWAGPDMSTRSSITARLMETWAHGQEIYDLLGTARANGDRIRNIAHLGVSTFGWTFVNRGEPVPEPIPHVKLTGPSGATWEWGAPSDREQIEGPAEAFCQVVCQTRNIADTTLKVTGPIASRWMSIAQCFAGPPKDPPPPGTRTINQTGLSAN
jgi:uncharacterized protein (TIGR03084 family)